uniref:Uncharacterized protein n=1 Tax=Oryza punctata TaxID=4537 RepID=A0A0E0MFN2_ORYPU
MQNGHFVAAWELAPPGCPRTPSSGDSVLVQVGHFVADWGSHLQVGWPLRRRLGARTSRPATYAAAGDSVHVQDVHFVVGWGLAPPGQLPMPPPGDFIPVLDGYFFAD